MSLNWRPISDPSVPDAQKRSDLLDRVYFLLNVFEPPPSSEDRFVPKLVRGNITIGIGFDLKAGGRTIQDAVFRAIGLVVDPTTPLDPTARQIENDYIDQLRRASEGQDIQKLHKIMETRAADTRLDGFISNRRPEFEFQSETEVRAAFDGAIGWYETRLTDRYTSLQSDTDFRYSQEKAVLLSMAWNSPGLLGRDLGNAVNKTDPAQRNRAEAWYEIRYKSNKDGGAYITTGYLNPDPTKRVDTGLAKRRFMEAALFGLYDDPNTTQASAEEAKQVYRMLQTHRQEILNYENVYGELPIDDMAVTFDRARRGNQIVAAQVDYAAATGLARPESLLISLEPAKKGLIADLQSTYSELAGLQAADYLSTAIFLGAPSTVNSLNATIFDRSGSEIVSKDIVMGGTNTDYLRGGKGDDVLIGGQGVDIYDFATGDGKDRIVEERDADGKMHGVIFIDDVLRGDLLASGVFVPTGPNTWQSLAHGNEITLTNNSPWKLVTDDGDEIELGSDFQDGDFGIELLDAPTAPQPTLTIVGDLTPTSGVDELGNLNVDPNSPAPDRADVLNGRDIDTEGDLIQSLGGDDVVAAKKGADQIEAGAGSDIVNAGDGNDLVLGGADLDLLWGMAGNDRLYADAELDLQTAIAQGETDLPTGSKGELMDGGEGEDILVGGPGNDVLVGGGGTGANVILGGAGNNHLVGETDEIAPPDQDSNCTSRRERTRALLQTNRSPSAGLSKIILTLRGGGSCRVHRTSLPRKHSHHYHHHHPTPETSPPLRPEVGMLHLLISGRRIVGTGSPDPGRHVMHRDRALQYPPVATPRYPTRHFPAAGEQEVFPCLRKFKHSEAERSPVPLARIPRTAGRSRREMR